MINALQPFVQATPTVSGSSRPSAATAFSSKFPRKAAAVVGVAVLVAALGGYGWYRSSQPDQEGTGPPSGQPAPEDPPSPGEPDAPPEGDQIVLTFRDWEGTWDLQWLYEEKRYKREMTVEAELSGISGDYQNGTLEGRFLNDDFSRVVGEITNTTRTGVTCDSGKQTGSFLLILAKDGRSMEGWWDVCGEGMKWPWQATKR